MPLLERSQWYDIARSTNWTPTHVTEDEIFPETMSGSLGIPAEKWESYDEPYKVSFRDYVYVQRDKDAGVYSVKAALGRSKFMDTAPVGWLTILKAHYGAFAVLEAMAASAEARMARFSKAPGMRNVATFGALDENRHGQIQLYFAHEHTKRSRQFDWAYKSMRTNEWAAVAARHFFDDIMTGRDAISIAIMLTFAFETGFSNMQFLGLAADAAAAGDMSFSNLISSVQTDEARHAQIGAPVVQILLANGKKEEAQRLVDVAIWRAWTLFAVVTGTAMDYYTPLERREKSFKEFMLEWIVSQFERTLVDLGLDIPWYWDKMIEDFDHRHHAMHAGIWTFPESVWWDVPAGVSPDEREWLEEKYPGWNDTWGKKFWDPVIDHVLNGRKDRSRLRTMTMLCNMSQTPIGNSPGRLKHCTLDYEGRTYHFGSEVDRWVFQQDPQRYKHHQSISDRFLAGLIQPQTMEGVLQYFGLHPGERGKEAHDFAWVEAYRQSLKQAG